MLILKNDIQVINSSIRQVKAISRSSIKVPQCKATYGGICSDDYRRLCIGFRKRKHEAEDQQSNLTPFIYFFHYYCFQVIVKIYKNIFRYIFHIDFCSTWSGH